MMDWQLTGTLLMLGAAMLYLSRGALKGLHAMKAGHCSSSCGCSKPVHETNQPGLVPEVELTARLQKRSVQK